MTYLTNMNLARASDADARKFGSLYFTGLLQTHTNSGRRVDNNVPPGIRDKGCTYNVK